MRDRAGLRIAGSAVSLAVAVMTGGAFAADPLGDLPDPTRPSSHQSSQHGSRGPVLHYTLISPTRSIAVIDGRRYGVGDRFAGGRIAAIRPYEVELVQGDRRSTLRLTPPITGSAADAKGE